MFIQHLLLIVGRWYHFKRCLRNAVCLRGKLRVKEVFNDPLSTGIGTTGIYEEKFIFHGIVYFSVLASMAFDVIGLH